MSNKTIAKNLVERIAHVLPQLISINQLVFLASRLIFDNTTLVEEKLRGFGQKSMPKRPYIVVDLQKTFDIVH